MNAYKNTIKRPTLLILLTIGLSTLLLWPRKPQIDKNEAKICQTKVPFFAVNTKGEPVYDLKKDELQCHIDGNPVEFQLFPPHIDNRNQEMNTTTHRTIVIIVDTMFNSGEGLARTKKILTYLIRKHAPNDRFVILKIVRGKGIQLITGPENNQKKLLNRMGKLKISPVKYKDFLYLDQTELSYAPLMKRDIRINQWNGSDRVFKHLEELEKNSDIKRYRASIKEFLKGFSKFNRFLRSLPSPRLVFLISEGIAKGALYETSGFNRPGGTTATRKGMTYQPYVLKSLKKVAEAINRGGSVLFVINPGKQDLIRMEDTFNTGETVLNYLAEASGGKYFAGQEFAPLVKAVEKTISALYEMTFAIPHHKNKNQKQKARLVCQRKGVRIFMQRVW